MIYNIESEGKNTRNEISQRLAQLNTPISVTWLSSPADTSSLEAFGPNVRHFTPFSLKAPHTDVSNPKQIFAKLKQIVIDTSSSSSPISTKTELNAFCRSISASYIAASTYGMLGTVFVDEGSPSATYEPTESFTSFPDAIDDLTKISDNLYRLKIRNSPLASNFVALSTRRSGFFKPNLHHCLPHQTAQRANYDALIDAEDTTDDDKDKMRRSVSSYYDSDYSAPCPLEGLQFPVVHQVSASELHIHDTFNVLDDLHPKVCTSYHIAPSRTITPKPLSSFHWTSDDFIELEESFQISNLEAEIQCFAPEMIPVLSTYATFLRLHLSENALKQPFNTPLEHGTPASTHPRASSTHLWNRLLSTWDKLFVPTEAFIASIVATEAVKMATKVGIPLDRWFFFDAPEMAELLRPSAFGPTSAVNSPLSPSPLSFSASEPAEKPSNRTDVSSSGDQVLLFPPSKHPLLAHASIAFSDFNRTLELTSQQLALSGVCSYSGTVKFIRPTGLFQAPKMHYQPQLDQLLLWKSATAFGISSGLPSLHLRPIAPTFSTAHIRALEALRLNGDCDHDVILGHQLLDEEFCSSLAIPYLRVWEGEHEVVSVENYIPHLAEPSHGDWIAGASWQAPSGHLPSNFYACSSWAQVQADTVILLSSVALTAFTPAETPTTNGLQYALEWIQHPRTTLVACVQWSKNWIISNFVHWPAKLLQDVPLVRFNHQGKLVTLKGIMLPYTIAIDFQDPVVANLVVLLSIISGMQSGVLSCDDGDFAQSLERHYSSKYKEIQNMACDLPSLSFDDYTAINTQNAGINQPSILRQIHNFALSASEESPLPKRLPPHDTFTGTKLRTELLYSLAILRSRCFALGDFPRALLRYNVDRTTLPTSRTASSALTTIETMKHLLLAETCLKPSSSLPFREYFLNMLKMELKPSPLSALVLHKLPNGMTWTDWDHIHLYIPRSTTPADIVNMLKRRFNVNLCMLFAENAFVWSNLPMHRRSTDTPIPLLVREGCEGFDYLILDTAVEDDAGEDISLPKLHLHFTP